jgi:hypothetical protein
VIIMQYWANIDGKQYGPLELEQLLNLNITPQTYVWRDGLADWMQAKNVSELAEILIKPTSAPPLPATPQVATPDVPADNVNNVPEPAPAPELPAVSEPAHEPVEEKTEEKVEEKVEQAKESVAEPTPEPEPAPEPATEVTNEPTEEQVPEPAEEPEAPVVAEQEQEQTQQSNVAPPPVPIQQPYAQPMQQYPPQQPIAAEKEDVCPSTNLVWAIISTILCCIPFGIVAILYSRKVAKTFEAGDFAKAKKYSNLSQNWTIAAFSVGVVVNPFIAVICWICALV